MTGKDFSKISGQNIPRRTSQQILQLVKENSDFTSIEKVIDFGMSAQKTISDVADNTLQIMEAQDIREVGKTFRELENIQNNFEVENFEKEIEAGIKPQGFFARLMNKGKDSVDQLIGRFKTMSDSVAQISLELEKYQQDARESIEQIKKLREANYKNIGEVLDYIDAGEIIIETIEKKIIPAIESELNTQDETTLNQINIQLMHMNKVLNYYKQRVLDLRTVEEMGYQSIPQYDLLEQGKTNIIIQSKNAQIIGIPVLKQALNTAIQTKTLMVQQKMLSGVSDNINKALVKNAQNIKIATKVVTSNAGQSLIKLDTLQKSREIIQQAIEVQKETEAQVILQNEQDYKTLEKMRSDNNTRLKEIESIKKNGSNFNESSVNTGSNNEMMNMFAEIQKEKMTN